MKQHFKHLLAAVALTVGLGAGAAPVNQAFTLTPDFGSSSTFAGSFSYDDAQTPTPSPQGETLFGLSSFLLSINGSNFTLGDLDEAFAVFSNNTFIGLAVTVDGVLTMSPAVGGQDAFFAYSGQRGDLLGEVVFAAVGTVDEPAGIVLALAALGAAAAARRRRG